ncbi:hypothetical protein SDC9_184084 [bioreactor metagenome]|uniref:Uncharacterized protein n=1 Tax=bioreactor metagenome TaxID=1076179 RepID=A0A645HC22_9ZZZZ
MDDADQQNDSSNQHHHTLHGIVQYTGAKSAERRIQCDTDAKNQQSSFVRNARCGFKQTCAANKLYGHCSDKRDQQAETRQPHQQAALVARKQHIVEGNSIITTRQNREFLTKNPQ